MATFGTFGIDDLPAPSDFELEAMDRKRWAARPKPKPADVAHEADQAVSQLDSTSLTHTGG